MVTFEKIENEFKIIKVAGGKNLIYNIKLLIIYNIYIIYN